MEEILNDVVNYLRIKDTTEQKYLKVLVKQAITNVINKRYPFKECSEQEQEATVRRYSNVIFNAVIYAYAKDGAEFQTSHTENGIQRSWIDEENLYKDVVPYIKIL